MTFALRRIQDTAGIFNGQPTSILCSPHFYKETVMHNVQEICAELVLVVSNPPEKYPGG